MISNEDKIKQRLQKSSEALDDAAFLLNNERYMAAVNRMYYAAFYVVTAYFAFQNILIKSHKGINIKLHSELVNQNIISKEEGNIFDMLLKLRGEFDYGDYAVYEAEEIKKLYADTVTFIRKIQSLIIINE